ncbi:MAG: TRAP transporter large permease [Acetobacterales bacterium]
MLFTSFLMLVVLLALALPVAAVLGLLGLGLGGLFSPFPLWLGMAELNWQHSQEYILIAIPLFILLGEIMLRAGIAERMYAAISQWLSWLPGGLMHANIGACAIFAATSGSSVATAATIGTLAIPQMEQRRYNTQLFLGSLAAGGTLGILIPPSINMILYGFLTDTSVPQLYLAGFIPGFLLAAMFIVVVLIATLIKPHWGGVSVETSWSARFSTLPNLIPPFGIFLIVVGSIYAGWATPTEAAALGVIAGMALAASYGRLSVAMLKEAIEGTMRTTAMTLLIVLTAFFLNFVLSATGMVDQVNQAILNLGWPPLATMLFIIGMYIVMGMFMDTLAMMVLTVPILAPVVVALGYDPVWFGILVMLVCEAGMITPPIGVICYVVQGIRHKGELTDVFIGIAPFLLALFAMMGLLLAFPQIALYLPELFIRSQAM